VHCDRLGPYQQKIKSTGMWLSKPLYEFLPYFYIAAGICLLLASFYLNYWYWPTICLISSGICLIGGLAVVLKRRDFRYTPNSTDLDD
jgi:hypothetical protein